MKHAPSLLFFLLTMLSLAGAAPEEAESRLLANANLARKPSFTSAPCWAGWADHPVGSWVEISSKLESPQSAPRVSTLRLTLVSKQADQLVLEEVTRWPGRQPTTRRVTLTRPAEPAAKEERKAASIRVGGRRLKAWESSEVVKYGHFTTWHRAWTSREHPWLTLKEVQHSQERKRGAKRKRTWVYKVTDWDDDYRLDDEPLQTASATGSGWNGKSWVKERVVVHPATGIVLERRVQEGKGGGKPRVLQRLASARSPVVINGRELPCLLFLAPSRDLPDSKMWLNSEVPGGFVKVQRSTKWQHRNGDFVDTTTSVVTDYGQPQAK